MSLPRRTLLLMALCLLSSSAVRAQQAADPTGHWEGTIQAPGMAIGFEIDFAKNDKGVLAGTVNLPGERIKGLPLTKVAIEGRSIAFHARSDQPMRGELSADGKTIAGDYLAQGNTLPFTMIRTGESKMAAPPKSAPISKQLEGTWQGVLETHGGALEVEVSGCRLAVGGCHHAGTDAGPASPPRKASTSAPMRRRSSSGCRQTIPGSRRNHVRWRFANRRVARTVAASACGTSSRPSRQARSSR